MNRSKTLVNSIMLLLAGVTISDAAVAVFKKAELIEISTLPNYSYTIESTMPRCDNVTVQSFLGDGERLQYVTEVEVCKSSGLNIIEQPMDDVSAVLGAIREEFNLPGISVLAWKNGQFITQGVSGNRKMGIHSPITIADKCHIGSNTKSMTATLAAILVDEGVLSWNTTVGEVFGDILPSMNDSVKSITIEQLLIHRAGINDEDYGLHWDAFRNHQGTPFDQRRFLIGKVGLQALSHNPGSAFSYSNIGYSIAGHMLETLTETPWETLMQRKLFQPLGITSAGFGAPVSTQYVDQPLGHVFVGGVNKPVDAGIDADNPPGIAPAGTVHMSLPDLVKYAQLHLQKSGNRQFGPQLVSDASMQKLHTVVYPQDGFAMGWVSVDRGWAGSIPALTHTGSNEQNFMSIWIAPGIDFVAVAYTNTAENGGLATDIAIGLVIENYL